MAINEPDYCGFGFFFKLEKEFWIKKKKGNIFEKSNEFFFHLILILFCNPYQPVSIIYLRLLSLSWIKSKCSFVIVLYMKYLYCNTMVQITGRIFSSYVETSSLKKKEGKHTSQHFLHKGFWVTWKFRP